MTILREMSGTAFGHVARLAGTVVLALVLVMSAGVDAARAGPESFADLAERLSPSVVNISSLYKDTGMFTYDPGLTSTASCESKITYIDGDEVTLLYSGYPLEQPPVN